MIFSVVNGAFVGCLLGLINAMKGNEITQPEFWFVMIGGIIINFIVNLTR